MALLEHELFLEGLREEDRLLVLLRDELYGGDWQVMRNELRDRLTGAPHVFRFSDRIEEDLVRITLLESYEKRRQVNLAALLAPAQV
ncbi:MAG: hypothetical protein HY719_06635 [Planctomycetes bacterium]|nr:hypothetical protein [Planctomycetota bacterium]